MKSVQWVPRGQAVWLEKTVWMEPTESMVKPEWALDLATRPIKRPAIHRARHVQQDRLVCPAIRANVVLEVIRARRVSSVNQEKAANWVMKDRQAIVVLVVIRVDKASADRPARTALDTPKVCPVQKVLLAKSGLREKRVYQASAAMMEVLAQSERLDRSVNKVHPLSKELKACQDQAEVLVPMLHIARARSAARFRRHPKPATALRPQSRRKPLETRR